MRIIRCIKKNLIILCMFLMFFQEILMNYIPIASYLDEVIVLIFFFIAISHAKILLTKYEKKQIILLMVIVIWGLICNILNKNEIKISSILIDVFSYIKVFLIYFSVINIIYVEEKKYIIRSIVKILKVITAVILVLGIINLIFGIDILTYDIRYGIKSYKFLYNNPGGLAIMMLVTLIFLLADKEFNNTKGNGIFIIFSLIIIILTLRAISLATFVSFIGLYYIFIIKKKKINMIYMLAGVVVIIVVGFSQIKTYLFNDETPRAQLLKYGIVTANDYFPFGAGFATYGSDVAADEYSYLYEKYGFNNRYGLSQKQRYFLNDNFWPMILGELGYIGLIIYCLMIYDMYKNFKYKSKEKKYISVATYTTLAYILISSVGSKILVHYMGITIFMALGIILTTKGMEKNIRK